ncbi:MAG: amidase [Woeseiaceae bacterium]|jgi:amidase|tara:strand:- start:25122 stop:26693 length:1572 start_codon:yes stop_codon:yes gene_type:complete
MQMVFRFIIYFLFFLFTVSCDSKSSKEISFIELTISDIQHALLTGKISCRGVVEGYLKRIATYDKSKGINAITVINSEALNKADLTDQLISNGEQLPELFCAPILVKDNFDTHDMITSGGSVTLMSNFPPDDAFMVRKLREAGAIIIAKTNMAEWAFSPRETVSSSFGRTANAYDINYVPAGSSGGTASAIAANFAAAGLGSDTGNSIRGPASHLALFGIRSTIGLTSRDGVIPLIFDRDIAGPMTRTVEDGARIFNVVAGYDSADPLTVPDMREENYLDFLNIDGLSGKRIGILRVLVDQKNADEEIKSIFAQAILDMESAGAVIVDNIEITRFAELQNEIKSCGSFRYDLKRYLQTLNSPPFLDVKSLLDTGEYAAASIKGLEFFSQFPLDLGPEERLDSCQLWPHNSLRNELLINTISAMDTANIDVLVYPTWSNPPALIDQASDQYKGDNNQFLSPSAGVPAITIPMGFWQNKLPAGLQILGRPYSEGLLIEISYSYEQLSQQRRPPDGLGSISLDMNH